MSKSSILFLKNIGTCLKKIKEIIGFNELKEILIYLEKKLLLGGTNLKSLIGYYLSLIDSNREFKKGLRAGEVNPYLKEGMLLYS